MFSNTASWNRLPRRRSETVPKSQEKRARAPPALPFGSTYPTTPLSPLLFPVRRSSTLPPLPLSLSFLALRFVMLIVSNSEREGGRHHRYVYFPFSSPSFLLPSSLPATFPVCAAHTRRARLHSAPTATHKATFSLGPGY